MNCQDWRGQCRACMLQHAPQPLSPLDDLPPQDALRYYWTKTLPAERMRVLLEVLTPAERWLLQWHFAGEEDRDA